MMQKISIDYDVNYHFRIGNNDVYSKNFEELACFIMSSLSNVQAYKLSFNKRARESIGPFGESALEKMISQHNALVQVSSILSKQHINRYYSSS